MYWTLPLECSADMLSVYSTFQTLILVCRSFRRIDSIIDMLTQEYVRLIVSNYGKRNLRTGLISSFSRVEALTVSPTEVDATSSSQ